MAGPVQNPRYVALDGYRFLAASGVALFHFDNDFRLGFADIFPAIPQLISMVDFFFMLSGFVIATGYLDRVSTGADYGKFLWARFARIYPLHLATLLIFVLLAVIASLAHVQANHPEIFAMSGLPANLLLLHAWGFLDHESFNVPSWSISAEWFVYLAAPLFFLLARRVHMAINLALVVGFIWIMDAVRTHAGLITWMDATYNFGMLRAVPTFFAGVVIAQWMKRTSISWSPPWILVHAIFAAVILVLNTAIPREFVLIVFAALIIAAALADRGGAPSVMNGPLLSTLGQSSYGLYMLHVLMGVPALMLVRKLNLLGTTGSLAVACTVYVAAVLLSIASHRYFETPARRWLMTWRWAGARVTELKTADRPA